MHRFSLFQPVRQRGPSHALVPPLVSRDAYWRRVANVLVFALMALAGEWGVHQVEYLIEYGQRFNAVMQTTPHRFYMAPLGVVFTVLGLLLITTTVAVLRAGAVRRSWLLQALPAWMHRLVPANRVHVPLRAFTMTALALALVQASAYLVQENLEAYGEFGQLPGLSVLLASQHATVIPLHILVACVASLLLWTIAMWRHALRAGTEIAEALVLLVLRWTLPAPVSVSLEPPVLERRLAAARRSLRSPPLAA